MKLPDDLDQYDSGEADAIIVKLIHNVGQHTSSMYFRFRDISDNFATPATTVFRDTTAVLAQKVKIALESARGDNYSSENDIRVLVFLANYLSAPIKETTEVSLMRKLLNLFK